MKRKEIIETLMDLYEDKINHKNIRIINYEMQNAKIYKNDYLSLERMTACKEDRTPIYNVYLKNHKKMKKDYICNIAQTI